MTFCRRKMVVFASSCPLEVGGGMEHGNSSLLEEELSLRAVDTVEDESSSGRQ
jgi:hypothetical protein